MSSSWVPTFSKQHLQNVRHNFPRLGTFWNNPKTVQKGGGGHTLRLKSQTPTERLCLAFFAQAPVWAHSLPSGVWDTPDHITTL